MHLYVFINKYYIYIHKLNLYILFSIYTPLNLAIPPQFMNCTRGKI